MMMKLAGARHSFGRIVANLRLHKTRRIKVAMVLE